MKIESSTPVIASRMSGAAYKVQAARSQSAQPAGFALSQQHSQFQDIAARYDVRNISSRDMARMSQEMYDNGLISLTDHAMLSFQPELAPAGAAGPGIGADVPRDFLAQWEQQFDDAARRDNLSPSSQDRHLLNLLHTLDDMRRQTAS